MPTELQEALQTAGSASALVQKIIDPVLLEYIRRYSQLVRVIPTQKWDSTDYYYNTRTGLVPGGFVTDGGARPVGASTYQQSRFTLRNLQAVGAVTGYAQEVTRAQVGSLRQREIDGAVQSLVWDIENACTWGNAASTAVGPYPEFDGLDTQVATFSGGTQNAIDEAAGNLTLSMLNHLIDLVESNAAMSVYSDGWMMVMSPAAVSAVGALQVNQQRFNQVEVATGLIVDSYRNVPLIKSSFLSARGNAMGTVTATTGTTTGSIAASTTYYYQIAPVIARYGELLPSTEVSQATGGGTSTNIITLAFTNPTGVDGGPAQFYKVFRSTGTGTETLLGYVDAVVGLAADGVTPVYANQIIDTGATLVSANSGTAQTSPVAAYTGGNTSHKPRSASCEDMYLIPRDPNFLVRPYVRDITPIDVYPTATQADALPFALMSDTCLATRAPKYLSRLRNFVPVL